MPIETLSFALGGLLLAVALFGGGVEVQSIKIPPVNQVGRLLSFLVGVAFVGLAVFLNNQDSARQALPAAVTAGSDQAAKSRPRGDWLTASQFQAEFDQKTSDGFYPFKIEARCENESEQFRAQWKGLPLGFGFYTYSIMTKEDYDGKNKTLGQDGFSLEFLTEYKDCSGVDRYAATWLKKNN